MQQEKQNSTITCTHCRRSSFNRRGMFTLSFYDGLKYSTLGSCFSATFFMNAWRSPTLKKVGYMIWFIGSLDQHQHSAWVVLYQALRYPSAPACPWSLTPVWVMLKHFIFIILEFWTPIQVLAFEHFFLTSLLCLFHIVFCLFRFRSMFKLMLLV